jgi:hypothetical protein
VEDSPGQKNFKERQQISESYQCVSEHKTVLPIVVPLSPRGFMHTSANNIKKNKHR